MNLSASSELGVSSINPSDSIGDSNDSELVKQNTTIIFTPKVILNTPKKSLHNIVEDHDLNGNTARRVRFEETYARGTEGFPTELVTSRSPKAITTSLYNDSEDFLFYQGNISTEGHSYRKLYSGIYGAINFPVGSYPYAQKRYNKVVE
jgi:hypothetical protein